MSDNVVLGKRRRTPTKRAQEADSTTPNREALNAVGCLLTESSASGRLKYLSGLFGVHRSSASRYRDTMEQLRETHRFVYESILEAAQSRLKELEDQLEQRESASMQNVWRYARGLLRRNVPRNVIQYQVQERYGVLVGVNALKRLKKGENPEAKMGAPCKIPFEYERRLVFAINQLTMRHYSMYRSDVKEMANKAIAGTSIAKKFASSPVGVQGW